MAPRYKCDYCENLALYGGNKKNATEDEKRQWKDRVKVCETHRDDETQNLVIAFYGGRSA